MPIGRRRNRIDRSLRERGVPPEPQHRVREVDETTGPYDEADAPRDGLPRIDLGSLRLPALPGTDLRVDLNAQQKVVSATLRAGESLLQVSVFAAPRAAGIWDDVRADIATGASGKGGSLQEAEGPFGLELAGSVLAPPPARPGQPAPTQPVRVPTRFLGVDGPRWFLRGVISGPAAADPGAAETLERAFREIVVVRGTAPMPVREQLPLTLPPQAAAQLAAQRQTQQSGAQQSGAQQSGAQQSGAQQSGAQQSAVRPGAAQPGGAAARPATPPAQA